MDEGANVRNRSMIRALLIVASVACGADAGTLDQLPYISVNERVCGNERPPRAVEGALLVISCRFERGTTIMQISVINLAPSSAGRLTSFDVGFCGASVISASAQSGWQVIAGGRTVEWKLPDRLVSTWGVEPRSRVGGFEVQLRVGWEMSASVGATWEASAAASFMTHDCQ